MAFRDLPAAALRIDGHLTGWRIYEARRFFARARGLLGAARLCEHEGLWISRCSSVHTLGMRYAIDVLFLDRMQRVVGVEPQLKPLRFAGHRHAYTTLELSAGSAAAARIATGSLLERIPI